MTNSMVEARHEGGAYRRVEVFTGRRRRQSWTADEKARIVLESLEAEENISEVARRNGVSRGLLTVWRRQARELGMTPAQDVTFAAVRVESKADPREETAVPTGGTAGAAASAIEVEISGATIRVPLGVDRATLEAVIAALRGTR